MNFYESLWKEALEKAAKKLTYKERERISSSEFAIPEERKYPIHDKCLHGDTLIPLLSGEEVPIKDLVGKEVWIYAYDLDKHAVVPAKATNIRKTIENAKIYKIVLDNNKEIICTDNHPFLTIDGKYVLANQLAPGTSLMPFITKVEKFYGRKPYLKIYQPWYSFWEPVQHMVCREIQGLPKTANEVVHHKDLNSFNNIPDNLEYMSRAVHCRLHAEINGYYNSDKTRKASLVRWSKPDAKKKQSEFMKRENQRRKEDGRIFFISRKITERKLKLNDDEIREIYKAYLAGESYKNLAKKYNISVTTIKQRFRRLNYPTKFAIYSNHKVISVKDAGYADVYDLEVPGVNNFAISAGVFVHNSHARNALARVSQHGTPSERERVRRAVYARYPDLKEKKEERIGRTMTKTELRERKRLPKK